MLIAIPALLFAGTLFEDEKKTSDPYVADRGGFNSMFVNPAGMAGQSGFELSVSVGATTTYNDVQLLLGVTDMALGMADAGGLQPESIEDVGQTLSDLYDNGVIDDALLDSLFDGTGLDPNSGATIDWSDPAAVQAAAESLPPGDITTIEGNVAGIMDGTNTDFYNALPGKMTAEAVASFKTGFIIKGVGLGIYDQAVGVAFMDPATQEYGLETVYNELGIIAGMGFNLFEGKLALGLSGNYGVLMQNANPLSLDNITDILDTSNSLTFGYTWGIDIGAIWRPTPSLGVGIVFNDVFGSTQAADTYTADGILGFISDGSYMMDSMDYEFSLDLDAGISWQPDWRFVRPKLGLDFNNVIGYGMAIAENGDSFEDAMYRSLDYIRVGADFTFFEFLKVGAQYHNHFLSLGAGLDLLFLELYGEVKVSDTAIKAMIEDNYGDIPIAGDLMVRIHF